MLVPQRHFCLVLLALAMASCSKANEAPAVSDPKVEGDTVTFPADSPQMKILGTMAAERRPVPAVRLNGRIIWNEDRTVRIYTPFAGRVERILVNPGDVVRKGQALAVVSSPDFGQAQSDAHRAEADAALAAKNLARTQELVQHGVAAAKELQSAQSDHARAAAELERARSRLAVYGGAGARVNQTYTLTSPIDGTLVEKNINPGQELRPDQMVANAPPLFVVTDPVTLWVQIDAAEKDLPRLKRGKTVLLRTPAYRNQTFPAKVISVSDFVDAATRTLKARALVENRSRQLKAEMFVTAEVDANGETEIQVPGRAVFFLNGKHYLFVEEAPARYVRREIKVDDEYHGVIEVLGGLKEGEKVVTEGTLLLQQVVQPRRVQK